MSHSPNDKMFRVLVLGGIALVAAHQDACGGTISTGDAGNDAAQNPDSFPSELPVFVEAGTTDGGATDANDGGSTNNDAFPSELPVLIDP